jgi:glucosyl-3-phosphoglycerate synthase
VGRLEAELRDYSGESPIALILPCHSREFGTKALRHIVRELKSVTYLKQIIVGIDQANLREWKRARKLFAQLPQKPTLLWNSGPRMQRLCAKLEEADLNIGPPGKGRNVWMCFGYVLASEQSRMVAVHDCDILTYSRELLARLCYPVAHPSLGFDFCKGYYARYTNKLNGRVMRLLVTPLLRSLKSIIGAHHPFLVYMDTFRYPLAGEFSLDLDLVRRNRVPADWGLEVGLLADVFRNSAARAICQSELCENYDHKHQELSVRDPEKGLNKMAIDIAKSVFRTMAAEGIKLDSGVFDTLEAAFVRHAEDALRQYGADAAINGLVFDRHEEEVAATTFVRSIRTATRAFLDDPLGAPLIPNWNRVQAALPNFLGELNEAVGLDNNEE